MAEKQYKQLSCRDFGDECAFLVRAETEEEVLKVGFDHACRIHKMCERLPRWKARQGRL